MIRQLAASADSRRAAKILNRPASLYDKWLIGAALGLVIMGLMMVASSSVMVSTKSFHQPFHFLFHQLCYLGLGLLAGVVIVRTESRFWEQYSVPLLLICIILLVLVLIPGLGHKMNGSRRWLSLGPIGIQVSELTKVAMILYLAGYLVRQQAKVKEDVMGFVRPMLVLGLVAVLLLAEPDFGATVVISSTVMALLFLTGVKLRYYLALLVMVLLALAYLAVSSKYRLMRLTAFLDPWADQYNTGYQLTQSLIAFGRGGWFGSGLGESVQKLFYLPESHTDFLFAVLAEELGLAGILLVLTLYSILITRGLLIGYRAYNQDRFFAAYTAYGISFWLGLQAAINMGVNAGLLPTKGLTLPLMSYGGASVVICVSVIAVLLRIDYENRLEQMGLTT